MRRYSRSAIWLGVALAACATAVRAQPSSKPLTRENRLDIVRVLAYEYATARQPLPATKEEKEALEIDAWGRVNEDKLRQTLANRGPAVETGEILQITAVEIKPKYILLEINGGGKRKKKWYERITIQAGGPISVGVPTREPGQRPAPPPGGRVSRRTVGSWIVLDFPEGVPDLSAEEVKALLAPVLDFSRRSAAVPWIDTIPEEFREAIKEERVMVGMDQEMVLAAKGRPDRKVRETKNGRQTEDWIYGNPPFVTFVVFVDDKVVEIKEYN